MIFCTNISCDHFRAGKMNQCALYETDEEIINCPIKAKLYGPKENQTISDPVDHPAHYQTSGVECIVAIESAVEGLDPKEAFLVGTAIKYLWRFKKKGRPVEDLDKAIWYINRLKEHMEVN